jgi:hypothetical protein
MVRMLLEMLPGPDFTLTVTGSPEEATGVVMAKGAFPKVLSAMGVKGESVCFPLVTVKGR